MCIRDSTWFDVEMVGGAFKTIANLLPFVHAVNAGRYALAGESSKIMPDLIWVIVYAIIVLAAAICLFTKKMHSDKIWWILQKRSGSYVNSSFCYVHSIYFYSWSALGSRQLFLLRALFFTNQLINNRGKGFCPVSYTHLDVYKRQAVKKPHTIVRLL